MVRDHQWCSSVLCVFGSGCEGIFLAEVSSSFKLYLGWVVATADKVLFQLCCSPVERFIR